MDILDARENNYIARLSGLDFCERDTLIDLKFGKFQRNNVPVFVYADEVIVYFRGAVSNFSDSESSDIVGIVEVRDEHLKRLSGFVRRTRYFFHYFREERFQVGAFIGKFSDGVTLLADRIEHGKLNLFFGCVEVNEQIVYFIQDFGGTRVFSVNLIYYYYNFFLRLEGFLQYEACLGKGTFGGVDEENRAVNHHKSAFDLAAKVSVSGRVENIYLYAFPGYGTILCGYSNTALSFEVHIVHKAFFYFLIRPEQSALPEHVVNERSFTVVNVSDYRYVS